MGRISNHSESPIKGRGSPHRRSSPPRKSPTRREKSPIRHKSSHRDGSPAREKRSSHAKSPKHTRSTSPIPRSPSPRTKRLKRALAEREAEKVTGREHERNHGRGSERGLRREGDSDRSERGLRREGDSDREIGNERKERRSGRDDNDVKSSRSRHDHSSSPVDRRHKSKRRSHSPEPALDNRARDGAKVTERDHERNDVRGSDRSVHRERKDREIEGERMDRRSGRDDTDNRSLRSRNGRSTSPSDRHHKNSRRSHSPQPSSELRARDEVPTARGIEERNDENDSVARMKAAEEALEAKQKQKPSFELSGKLAAETNRVRGVTLLFNEPPDARKPDVRWRLYVFKAGEVLNEPLYIHRQSCYLFGRERRVADIPTDHPSCSKQHAVIQYREVEKEQPDGMLSKQIKPYIMDLGSTNKTFINETAIEPQRYYELKEQDTIKFGNSSREYVLLHENSAGAG